MFKFLSCLVSQNVFFADRMYGLSCFTSSFQMVKQFFFLIYFKINYIWCMKKLLFSSSHCFHLLEKWYLQLVQPLARCWWMSAREWFTHSTTNDSTSVQHSLQKQPRGPQCNRDGCPPCTDHLWHSEMSTKSEYKQNWTIQSVQLQATCNWPVFYWI